MKLTKKIIIMTGIAAPVLLAAAPALAGSPRVGAGVMASYIGDVAGSASKSWSTAGTQPLPPGTSGTWTVVYVNSGNVPEDFAISQQTPAWLGGTPVPASWVRFSPAAAASVRPGCHVTVTVTVSVPARARPGVYDGVLYGTARQHGAVPQPGKITLNVAAGDREYIRVP